EPPTDKELEVAGILCDLEELILKDEFRRSNLSLVAGMSSWGTKKPRTLRHKPPGPLPPLPLTLPSPPSIRPPPLPSPPYNVHPPPSPTAEKEGGEGCGGTRFPSPVTPLSFPGSRAGGDNDDARPTAVATTGHGRHTVENDAGSSAPLPSLPGNSPEHNDAVATSGHGWYTVDDDVGPSAAAPPVPWNRSEHDDALATSGQGTHTVDDDAGPSAAPPSKLTEDDSRYRQQATPCSKKWLVDSSSPPPPPAITTGVGPPPVARRRTTAGGDDLRAAVGMGAANAKRGQQGGVKVGEETEDGDTEGEEDAQAASKAIHRLKRSGLKDC
ncbi:hypothetical protein BHE74_00049794, partial [Ensete ventricosum]